jgi:hypothetical protein
LFLPWKPNNALFEVVQEVHPEGEHYQEVDLADVGIQEKIRTNQTKHSGLDFESAARVCHDPNMVLMTDRVVDGEQRWYAIEARFCRPSVGGTYLA